jgi:hypothetical protein
MDILSTAVVAPQGKLNIADIRKMGMNVLVFTAPALVIFFGQLAAGVNWRVAGTVALLALYGIIADFIKKISDGPKL